MPIAIVLAALLLAACETRTEDQLGFWSRQRKGANCQNSTVEPAYWEAAAALGLDFIRLMPDAWQAHQLDFLIGRADHFTRLNDNDLSELIRVLEDAERAGVKVVLAMLSLPGARWRQLNQDKDDARLWRDADYQKQAAEFWRQLAGKLKDHPTIVAYNPLNEPHPERAFGFQNPDDGAFPQWVKNIEGTPADLNAFNRRIVAAIRESDQNTPIILDGWFYASPLGLQYVDPLEDRSLMYAFL
ncbi:glycoside hydrolase family 5 protein [Acidobacteria bacterium AH-259-O06]|nr:glycoside hydrolase family 5 protein [Acidobacteria bacterium AH-259-O06]